MEVDIPEDTSEKMDNAAKILGIDRHELIDRAIQVYLDSLSKYLELKKDFQEWNILSDEALANFEKNL